MRAEDRSAYILELDEAFLKGGIVLSEWCAFIVRECDYAFIAGANLATIITSLSGIETYLRSEYEQGNGTTLYTLIEQSPINDELKSEIHTLRRYRNKWVHISDPMNDCELLENLERYEKDLENSAKSAIRVLRRTIYENPWV